MDWDERFLRGDELHDGLPSPPLPQAVLGVQPGRALNLASGAGRHALFLAGLGWQVHAVEGSRVGVQRMLDEAHRRQVSIEAEIADLEAPGFAIAGEYDLVCDFYFLHRPLFGGIREAVRPGGLFVASIHVGEGRFSLAPGELRALVESWGWTVLHYREGASPESGHHRPAAELIARR